MKHSRSSGVMAAVGMALIVSAMAAEDLAVHVVDRQYRTPLHHAVRDGDVESIQRLLRSGARVKALDQDGNPPLLYARNPDVIQLLLEHGADVNAQNSLGNTLLHNSVFYPPVVSLLIARGADVNRKNLQGQTPLDIATLAARDAVAAQLIRQGADIAGPLHNAADNGQVEAVKRFLENGVDVDTRDGQGQTVLHKALSSKSATLEMAKLLLDHGADAQALNPGNKPPCIWRFRLDATPIFWRSPPYWSRPERRLTSPIGTA